MLGRQSLRQMTSNLFLPIGLAVASLLLAYTMDTVHDVNSQNPMQVKSAIDETSLKAFMHRERYMHLMSRLAYCFVNVASKVFMFKESAFQKAWSRLSEKHNHERFAEVMAKFADKN